MLWESGSDNKNDPNERGWVSNDPNPLLPPTTPVLVPTQSGQRLVHQTVPLLVPDVDELKEQFQQQQYMLTQLKESIKENESQLSSKEKKVEAYANKLSQIRARSKNNDSRTTTPLKTTPPATSRMLTKKPSKENLSKECEATGKEMQGKEKLSSKGKIGELKKRLQESKIKFEERTGKEVSETKKIVSIVENLRMQLEERDVTIQELQKIVEQPPVLNAKFEPSLQKSKSKSDARQNCTKSIQTMRYQPNDESVEIIALQNRIYELQANVLDLEESLKEKESVIDARTQAVTLLSQDLSIKGKNTLDCLEETRQEMRSMQNNFVIIESQLKKELVEKDDQLTSAEEKLKKLELINVELSSRNADLQERLAIMEKNLESSRTLDDSIVHVQNDDKIEELTKKINSLNKELDDSNKSMIKMKLEHKNKIKSLNKTIEKLKEESDDKAEILRLQTMVEEFEVMRECFQNKIAELEEEKVTEKTLKDTINELEAQIRQQSVEISNHLQTISNLEREKFELLQSSQDQNIVAENLCAKIQTLEAECASNVEKIKSLEEKLEAVKSEHSKEIESLESYYNVRMAGGDRREFEEYRITNELNNVQVEEQIEMLIREKQQLLEKLKSLSGVSSTDSINLETFENIQKETRPLQGDAPPGGFESGDTNVRELHLQKLTEEQQALIAELQNAIGAEKEKVIEYQKKMEKLEESLKSVEQVSSQLKPVTVDEGEGSKALKSNSSVKNKIKKMQTELVESRKTIQQQNEKLEELNIKLEEKEQLIKNYIEKIELFEKDDWGRENDWKTTQDEFDNIQELQKKCLSLENSLIELTEDCERLRKENIEVVHLLSEEKVKRKKLIEKYHIEDCTTDPMSKSMDEWTVSSLEEKIYRLIDSAEIVEEKLRKLEMRQLSDVDQSEVVSNFEAIIKETQEKLEWSNIVLTSKETEIFRLQNLLEDNSKTIEDLENGLKEANDKLVEKVTMLTDIGNELQKKENQIKELSVNFERLQENMRLENERTSSNESQLKQLMATVQFMESDAAKKECELKEIQGILAEKNLDIHNLKQWLEQANSDLTYSYREHLENMDKCLRDKEQEYNALLVERNEIEQSHRNLISINEDLTNQKVELLSKNEALQKALEAKENSFEELNAKLSAMATGSDKTPEIEDLKIKVKKLSANLKKKILNEKYLIQQVKDHEQFLEEREKITQKLQEDLTEVNEKWLTEKSEKDQFKDELSAVLAAKSVAETENADLKERLKSMEIEYNSRSQKDEYKFQQMETQLQKMYENSERMRSKQEQDKAVIANLESELQNVSRLYENLVQTSANADEELRKALAETSGKFEEMKLKYEELFMERSKADGELNDLKLQAERLKMDNSCQQAKIQEQMAVIESLENDLTQTQEHLRSSQEKLCFLEDRRSSLENKTEEMMKKIEEDSRNVILIEDLSNQIRALTESEQNLISTVKSLDDKKKEMQQEAKELASEKAKLEKEIGELRQKVNTLHGELERMKELDAEKTAMMEFLTNETEKLKSLNKQRSADVDKLHKDIQLLEADLKENMENSKTVERTLNNKVDELLKENALLTDKINAVPEHQEESKPVRRKKSVTFRTDETDYIRELKGKMQEYSEELQKSNEEMELVKMELLRERLKNEVTDVVSEAKEKVASLKSTPEKEVKGEDRQFDAVSFFGAQEETTFDNLAPVSTDPTIIDHDSLMWDDGWGTDGHLEEQYLSSQPPSQEKYESLERQLKELQGEKQRLEEDLQAVQTKYAKAIKKMKEQKMSCDKLQGEVNRLKSDAEFGGLDAAMMDELKSQIAGFEQREKELVKNLEASKSEKDGLLKVIEVLNAGKEKFQEMKERKDNQMEVWEAKNRELQTEIKELRNQLEIQGTQSAHVDENDVIRELRNKIEGLEWENCELKESLEEKMELLEMRKEEVKTEVGGPQQAAANLPTEMLQAILDERKKAEPPGPAASTPPTPSQVPEPSNSETKIFDYFKAAPANDVFSSVFAQPVYAEPVAEPVIERRMAAEVHGHNNDLLEKELEQLRVENDLLQQQLSEAQSIMTKMKNERHEMAEKYRAEYESALSFHLEEKNNALQKVYELEQALAIKIEELNNISTRMRDLDQAVTLKTEELNSVNKGRQELEQAFGMKAEESSNMWMRLNELEQILVIKADEVNATNARLAELEDALDVKNKELNNTMRSLSEVQNIVRSREEELLAKTEEVSRLTQRVRELEEETARQAAALENLQKTFEEQLKSVQSNVPEMESLITSLEKEKTAKEELNRIISEREELIRYQAEEITLVRNRLNEVEGKVDQLTKECKKQRLLTEEYCDAKEKLEDLVGSLQTELQTSNMELELSRKELESLRRANEDIIAEMEAKMEGELREGSAAREELRRKTEEYERRLAESESREGEKLERVKKASKAMEQHLEALKSELKEKESDIFELGQTLDEEEKQLTEVRALLEVKDAEIAELRQALTNFQEEISSFRNFEKQVKELRMAQIKQTGSNMPVTSEGDPDFTNWTEHELAELSTRLQSDLDTALYMLHQRDIRCDELTFELMQLLEERDTLQLRLSTALRINEELRCLTSIDTVSYVHDTRQDSKDLVDQSNDRQGRKAAKVPEENLQELAHKISELHSVGYMKDKTIQDDSMQRHRDQMTLLGRVSDIDLGRDASGSPPANQWIRTGKTTTPKVMHI